MALSRRVAMVDVQRKTEQQLIEELSALRTRTAELQAALADQTRNGGQASVILDAMPMRVSYIDSEGRYQFGNRTFCEWFGRSPSEISSKTMTEILGETTYVSIRRFVEAALAGQRLSFEYRSGATYSRVTYTPDFGPDGELRGFVSYNEDVTERTETERQLQRYEHIVASSHDLLALLDRECRYLAVNQTYAETCGYTIEELIGSTPAKAFGDEFFNTTFKPHAERCLRGEEISYQTWLDTSRLGWRCLDIRYYPHRSESGKIVGFVTSARDITESKNIETELRKSRERLQNLSASLRIAREEEKTHIAREIHDELGQGLTALKMDLSWLDKRLGTDQAALSKKIGAMIDLVEDNIRTVQTVTSRLRPGVLDDLGIAAAIEWQAAEFQQRTGINCRTRLMYDDPSLGKGIATTIFRVFQETLTNVTRHSEATGISVSLIRKGNSLALSVKDNGRGITRQQIASPESVGLIGMRERADSCGGKITITGIQGRGTLVELTVPLTGMVD